MTIKVTNEYKKIALIIFMLGLFLVESFATDYYISTTELNLRSGAGKNYKSITVLSKGDTVTLLDSTGDYWAKIQYKDKIGYSAKQYLQKLEMIEEAETESGNGFIVFLVFLTIVIVVSAILKKTGEKYRYKSTATVLSFFLGAFGFQKFYLGEKNKGVYSILFCWTFIPSLVGLIDFIKLAVMKEARFNDLYNWGKRASNKNPSLKPVFPKTEPFENQVESTRPKKGNTNTAQTNSTNIQKPKTDFSKSTMPKEQKLGLGDIYKRELGLDVRELNWLNQIKNISNSFLSIQDCAKTVIRIYLQLLYQLIEKLNEENATLQTEIKRLEKIVIEDFKKTDTSNFDWDRYEGDFIYKEIETEIFNNLFIKSENALRKKFDFNKLKNEEFRYLPLILAHEFNEYIGNIVVNILPDIVHDVEDPNFDTQIELNKRCPNRWKNEFEKVKKQIQELNTPKFFEKLLIIEETNKENPNIGNMFFEASKILAHLDKEKSLKLYVKYIYYDEKNKNFQFKKLPKRIEDLLFDSANQQLEYIGIQEELRNSHDLSKAFMKIEKLVIKKKIEKHDDIKTENEAFDREIFGFANRAYPDDKEMQEYVYNEQIESKKFMQSVKDVELINFAKNKYPDDYAMQEYVFKEQTESKAFMSNVKDKEIQAYALKQYPEDYSMQEYTYKEQAKSKSFMKKATDKSIKEYAIAEYPEDYSMQEYIYNEQIALPENERAKIEVDETIIDVNTQNLDLSVEKSEISTSSHQQPPYWGHTYVYSYDEIKHATKAQKQFYVYFKNQVANGNYVDIQGNTNYAFILYFDFLNEYQNHRDIKLLDEQFKLLGEICPKTRSYSLRSLQDELRKRSDSYSVDKLKDLEEPSYQFEHGYSGYNPDLYKLGNLYKDKLGLNKQEIRWLNKFYNPTNVFLSIEGCCIATVMQYVTLLKELEKQLKKKETTLAKEVTYFKEKLKAIYVKRNSDWGYYDTSYLGNRAESEVYLTLFKRVENSVRESYGHKRKVSGDFSYADKNLSEEFETKLGNSLKALIEELKDNVGQPNLETQIELNAQNVNRWRIGLDELIVSFEKDKTGNFIDGVIHLEETNQKNPNIENIFYQASKFISKYDKVQSLKYYAKYIYYDLKSKKFDNKALTKTVQKSLFKKEEQINDFKEIIADLIATNDIQTALDKISKIYIPKRKRIQLDRSEIQEVEQKHEGTVELLNEYLVDEKEKPATEISNDNGEGIEITIIASEENNSVFISEISMGQVQEELVKMIINNSFEIHQNEVDKYATANGMFKNQLIDSINEACEEHLEGEALIEEDDENYIIEESYYKEIAK